MMTRLSLAASAALLATAAFAQDEGLYPEPSAPDASFLRVHADPGATVMIDGSQPLDPASNGMTPYVEISPGSITIRVDTDEQEIEAAANMHYTFLPDASGGDGSLLTDAVTDAPGEADLLFYNLTDLPTVDLHVPEADIVALPGVEAGQGAGVALRAPLTLGFAAQADGETLAETGAVEMRQRTGTSLVLTGSADSYTLTTATNAYGD